MMRGDVAEWRAPAGRYNAGVDLVDRHVGHGRGDKLAYVDTSRRLTYGDLRARTDRFARALQALGIRREQRVILILLDSVDFPVAFLGALKAGVVAVPLNTLLNAEQWRYMIEDSRAEAIVVSGEVLDRALPVVEQVRASRPLRLIVAGDAYPNAITLEELVSTASTRDAAADTHADEVAFWLYTSGSTGSPKAARHVHASLACAAELYGHRVLGISEDDICYSAAKLFFAYGLGNSLTFPLSVGATTVLVPERPAPERVLATMRAHSPTLFFGVPTLYAAMLASPSLGRGLGSTRLRWCVSAGEPLPSEIARQWKEVVGVDILDGIGSTEMLHIFISNRPGDIRYGSTGTPVPGYEARVVDEAGAPVPTGDIGELIVRGPTAAEGYWNQRQRSRTTFVGEWTHTGDKYRSDERGYFYYCGRTDDMFKVSGIWVSPFEIESALLSDPAVLEAAVIGQEDVDGLMKPRAFIVLRAGVTSTEALFARLKDRVKATAGPWKYPRWIDVVAELPKTATGKIQRFKLRGG